MPRTRKAVSCPVEVTLRVIEGRWKVMILHHLLQGTQRFNALQRLLRGIAARTLAKQLRDLERDGLVRRKVYPEIPPRVEYTLTPLGKSLEPILMAMHEWGEDFSHRVPRAAPSR